MYDAKPVKTPKKLGRGTAILIAVVAIVILLFIFTPWTIVPAGHSGVVVTMGRVSDNVLSDGLHFKLPWQNVIFIDNRAQKAELKTQAFSSDIQQVDVDVSVNYSVTRATSQELYKNVGTTYYNTVMLPRIMENVKGSFSKYTAENLVGSREMLSQQVKDLLIPEMASYGIEILSVAIENVDFTNAFTDAVEAKQVAEQTKLKAEIEQSEMLMVERSTAERAVIAANADADVAKINADAKAYAQRAQAEAEAEANKMIAQSITPELIDYVKANGWDGALPRLMSGSDSSLIPIVNLEEAAE